MHSAETTDLSILHANLQDSKPNQQYVVLITTGALNPVHRSHISNLVRTKQYLERVHNFKVIGGYLSPTHDEYVQLKLMHEFVSGEHRIEMCRKAIQEAHEQHWLSVDQAECMAPEFVDLESVAESLQTYINEKVRLPTRIRVIYVAGLDLFNRYYGINGLRKAHMGGVAVVFRAGQNNRTVRLLAEKDPKLFYIHDVDNTNEFSDNESEDISSTLIRKRLARGEDCEQLTYQSVIDHMKCISSEKQ